MNRLLKSKIPMFLFCLFVLICLSSCNVFRKCHVRLIIGQDSYDMIVRYNSIITNDDIPVEDEVDILGIYLDEQKTILYNGERVTEDITLYIKKSAKKINYNAELIYRGFIEDDDEKFKNDFLKENRISGVRYKNENYDPSDPDSLEYIYYDTFPQSRMFIIDNQEDHDNIFLEDYNIDFSKEMVVLYMFAGTNNRYDLNEVILKDKVLIIEFLVENIDTTSPICRCLVVKIDKLEIDDVEIKKLSLG